MSQIRLIGEEAVQEYLRGLKPGERVVETAPFHMFYGREGTVYLSENTLTFGSVHVMWDDANGRPGTFGTSATWGTRRIHEAKL